MSAGNYKVSFEAVNIMARRITEIWFAMSDKDRIKYKSDINVFIFERIIELLDKELRFYELEFTKPERKNLDE